MLNHRHSKCCCQACFKHASHLLNGSRPIQIASLFCRRGSLAVISGMIHHCLSLHCLTQSTAVYHNPLSNFCKNWYLYYYTIFVINEKKTNSKILILRPGFLMVNVNIYLVKVMSSNHLNPSCTLIPIETGPVASLWYPQLLKLGRNLQWLGWFGQYCYWPMQKPPNLHSSAISFCKAKNLDLKIKEPQLILTLLGLCQNIIFD